MDAALWGLSSAVSFGTADFLARFTGRRLAVRRVLVVVLVVGLLPLSLAIALSGQWPTLPGRASLGPVLVYGVATAVTMLLLYEALARGPVTVVAPVVAAHPALIVAFAVVLGRDPSAAQWLATAVVLGGAIVTARFVGREAGAAAAITRPTLLISMAAAVSYAVMIVSGQTAVPLAGDAQTAWWGRLVALAVILALAIARRPQRPVLPPANILGLLALQGLLDGGGHLLLFLGSHGAHPEIAAVAASAFGAVTTVLAYAVLREPVRPAQWGGIAMVFAGVLALSALE